MPEISFLPRDEPAGIAIKVPSRRAAEGPQEFLPSRVERVDGVQVVGCRRARTPAPADEHPVVQAGGGGDCLVLRRAVRQQQGIRRHLGQERSGNRWLPCVGDVGEVGTAASVCNPQNRPEKAPDDRLRRTLSAVVAPALTRRLRVEVGCFVMAHPFPAALTALALEGLVGFRDPLEQLVRGAWQRG